ncbi:MAG: DUF4091 domain-containing protein [Akkermansia sp.]|nr:DUF4091 domain-containing protein [Akkermansia sp.]
MISQKLWRVASIVVWMSCQSASAQDLADRHPLYDSASPRQAAPVNQAKQLKIVPTTEQRLAVGTSCSNTKDAQPAVLHMNGWRGERCSGQLVISTDGGDAAISVSCTPLSKGDKEIPATVRMVRYVQAANTHTADIIGNETQCNNPAGIQRAVWYEVNVPRDAEPGVYQGTVTAEAPGCEPASQPIVIQVEQASLPEPKDWKIHLDLWQYPYSVARWHDVEPWSEEHFALLRPLMKRLAEAGQKCITCTLLDEAWNAQTYDWYPSMVRWVRGKDGVMRYDYSVLDKWIHFMHDEIGIREQISCYSMLPWHLRIQYYDEETGQTARLSATPGKPEFEALWAPFLQDFHRHMQEKGWAEKTSIAIDERPDYMVREAMRLVQENAPSFRIASAVDKPSELTKEVDNISPVITHAGTALGDILRQRKAAGKITTFYVCLHPRVPNTFTTSSPAESEWLGFFAAANHLDGFLRWAYNAWNRNPMQCTDFGSWPTGDCFLVYPGNRSSIRFERLRDGIEEYEKITLLRARSGESPQAAAAIELMNSRLAAIFTVERSTAMQHAQDIAQARSIVAETLRALPSQNP